LNLKQLDQKQASGGRKSPATAPHLQITTNNIANENHPSTPTPKSRNTHEQHAETSRRRPARKNPWRGRSRRKKSRLKEIRQCNAPDRKPRGPGAQKSSPTAHERKKGDAAPQCHWRVESQRRRVASRSRALRSIRRANFTRRKRYGRHPPLDAIFHLFKTRPQRQFQPPAPPGGRSPHRQTSPCVLLYPQA
jgi:hypothetical protein